MTSTRDDEPVRYALAAGVYTMRDGKVLMLERTGAFMAGFWSVPGGFAEAGETPREAALRELFEEAAIAPTGPVELVTAVQLRGYGIHILSLRFAADCDDGEVRTSNEHTGAMWIDPLEYREQHLGDAALERWRASGEDDAVSLLANRRGFDDFLEWRARRQRPAGPDRFAL